ncbi:MAG: hypothetical protein JST54_31265 [Deltaproteobacteria bacterium]|nr:hypothetical protein [Deltaproteobacteria bacterium]
MSTALIVLTLAPLTLTQSHPSAATASHAAASSAPRASNATSAHLAPPPHIQPNGRGSNAQPHGSQPAAPTHHAEGVAAGNAHPAAPISDGNHSRHHDGCGPRAPGVQASQQETYVESGVVVVYGPTDEAVDDVSIDGSVPPDVTPPPDDANQDTSTAPQDTGPEAITVDDGSGEPPVIYRWVDGQGGVHYSSAELVPESSRDTATPTHGEPIVVTHPE